MSNLSKKAVHGAKWMTFSTIILMMTQMVSIAVLVRFLEKSDFGIMAIIMVVKGFADLFMDFGITVAILHKQNISQEQYSSLYWLNMIVGFIIYGIIYLITPLIAEFYGQMALRTLIPLMCLAIPFSSVGRQQKTVLQKELYFKQIAIVDSISAFVALLCALYLAYYGYGVYALVLSNLVRYTLGNVIFFFICIKLYPIKFYFKFKETVEFLKIGGYHTISQVVNYFTSNFDVLIIGKLLGTEAVGIYNLAKDLVRRPSGIVAPIISKVATPLFSKIQDDATGLNNSFFSVQKIVSHCNGFIYLAVFTLAKPFVTFYYGETYLVAVPIVQILAFYYFLRQYGDAIGMICIAKGRTDIDMWWNLIVIFITPLFIWIGAKYSLAIVAFFLLLSQVLFTYPGWYMYTNRLLGISFFKYYTNFFKTSLIFIIPILLTLLLVYFLQFNAVVVFFAGGFLYTFSVIIFLRLFDKNFIKTLMRRVKK